MKLIVLVSVVFFCLAGDVFAQNKGVGSMVLKEKKKPPLNWGLLSFSTDSVYGMEVYRAYEFLKDKPKKRKVIVAVIDSGTDVDHEDLKNKLWVNPNEIPGNGVDDDGNGYVDDIHGWNFLGKSDGTVIGRGVEERNRYFMLHRARYDELFSKKRNKREEKEFIRLRDLFQRFGAGKMYLDLEKAKEEGDEEKVAKAESRFVDFWGTLKDHRPLIGDDLENVNDRFYGNNVLWASSLHIRVRDHGTHVAGIIGAERGNGIGIDGVADEVELMIVRAIPDGDEYDKDVANAIRYAVDNGANIINMSFSKLMSPQEKWVQKALRYAEKKGVLLVRGAGNSSMNVDDLILYPHPFVGKRRISSFMIVGASDMEGNPAIFSNFGQKRVDVFAPGDAINSTISGNKYAEAGGTSMASPMVAGVAAILMAYYPELSASQVKDIIMRTAITRRGDIVSHKIGYSYQAEAKLVPFATLCIAGGIVNAYEAVKMADQMVNKK